MTTQQPEALQLAFECEESAFHWVNEIDTRSKAARMLRAQHARIAELEVRIAQQAAPPFGWFITKSKLPGDVEFTKDPERENLARSCGYQTQALYEQPAAQGMEEARKERDIIFFLAGWNGCSEGLDANAQFKKAALAAQAKQDK